MTQNTHYPINTVADFLKVPEDRIDACLKDFRSFLEIAYHAKQIKTIFGWETLEPSFVWIDDDCNTATIALTDITTGEVLGTTSYPLD